MSSVVDEKRARAALPADVERVVQAELASLEGLSEGSSDAIALREHLDWLCALPWTRESEERVDLAEARAILDASHCALVAVKSRILEFLAVRRLDPGARTPAICFAGPRGVGKTSLGRAIARALHREFVRESLGGVRDEGEIHGRRRTEPGARPGRILRGLRRAATRNPVFLLDEIDQLEPSRRGDPVMALLEALDPERNAAFLDHYLGAPFDLSRVLFLATANVLDPIPPPLRERMEVIEIPGYTADEKAAIAARHLVPRALAASGLGPDDAHVSEEAVREIVRGYTCEAGVRQLERELLAVGHKLALCFARGDRVHVVVDAASVRSLLGPPRQVGDAALRTRRAGTAIGLARTVAGGELSVVEAVRTPGSGRLKLTGERGAEAKESAQVAFALLQSRASALGAGAEPLEKLDLHVHLPAGAIPHDRPGAGLALFVALASLLTGRRVRGDVAMAGELSLGGIVLRVGGVVDKVLAARRAGLFRVLLPEANRGDLDLVAPELRREMQIVLVETVEQALAHALEPAAAAAAAVP